ncbi:retrotransposon ty1-copia subclass [Plasmopara halstedii]|uniref:Retrotransposon ty1-copia subclass n=1 Tax=Plasmopara halstedii TaxID=4781 RepID=A0A0P1AIB5_PLAHL|nr:retrotransposon ty1-copia subclass [Plasmopara halstedii]CEG40271.1 retrotransposon ty1-copia subclass [Plasmopara halstedii]|eukprot:XP_024576640.1 retrotransposon ty1-copia subclass [Plasmopara halstedii]
MLLLNDGSANYEAAIVESTNNDEHHGTDSGPDNDDQIWPPSPTRPSIDEDGLLAEAVLAYAASVGEADDAPTTYQQAMDGDDAAEWMGVRQEAERAWASGSVQGSARGEEFQAKVRRRLFRTYSPVANMNSIRVVLAATIKKKYVTEQLDADTAILNSDLKERVYTEVPYGIEDAEGYMCRLDKAIYGL